MKTYYPYLLILSLLLSSCVSQDEYKKVIAENDQLKGELEDIRFGLPNLLADGKKFFEAKDLARAREKFQMVIDKYPDATQSIEARSHLAIIDEEELWQAAMTEENISTVERYINMYPKGKYVAKAQVRKNQLKKLNMDRAYDYASDRNTSDAWRSFLETYPNHSAAASIKEKIIRLEVDEISNDRSTGVMPSFDSYSGGYSSSSSVAITNDTRCTLTVRYSGPEARSIDIPAGSTRTVYLTSGEYKIAATACGSNYAGMERLSGTYKSTFYIVTSSYRY